MKENFDDWWTKIDLVDGWLSEIEARELFRLAEKSPGAIVEIGSWKGRSSAVLAIGAHNNPLKPYVVCIDPFTGSEEHRKEDPNCNTWNEFWSNITELDLFDIIHVKQMTSREAFADFKGQLGMVFLDGSHEYEDVKFDFLSWGKKVKRGGYICLHDYNWEGPMRVVYEYVHTSKYVVPPKTIGSLLPMKVR